MDSTQRKVASFKIFWASAVLLTSVRYYVKWETEIELSAGMRASWDVFCSLPLSLSLSANLDFTKFSGEVPCTDCPMGNNMETR